MNSNCTVIIENNTSNKTASATSTEISDSTYGYIVVLFLVFIITLISWTILFFIVNQSKSSESESSEKKINQVKIFLKTNKKTKNTLQDNGEKDKNLKEEVELKYFPEKIVAKQSKVKNEKAETQLSDFDNFKSIDDITVRDEDISTDNCKKMNCFDDNKIGQLDYHCLKTI